MISLFFRDARLSDLPEIVRIYNSTIASGLVTADTAPVSVESRQPWFTRHTPASRPLLVVEDEDREILGWLSFQSFYGRPAYDATAELSIYLKESQRGKGIGRGILQHAMDIAPALGLKTLLGFIFSVNTPSLKLFRSFGFDDWGFLPNVASIEGVERSLCILGKRLV